MLTFDYDGEETQEDNNLLERGGRSAYARCLMIAYCAVVRVHKQLVTAFCKGDAKDEAALTMLAAKLILDLQLDWFRNYDVRANLEVECLSVDLEGNCCLASPGSRTTKYLKVALRHITSLDQPPVDLGAVAFGETFLEPPGHEPPGQQDEALVLTEKMEPLCGWLSGGQEEDTECMSSLISRLRFSNKNRHYSMGSLLKEDAIQGVRLLTGRPEMPTIKGQLWVFQRGLIFSSLRLGSIALDFAKHVASISVHAGQVVSDRGAPDSASIVSFGLKGNFQQFGIVEANVSVVAPYIVISAGEYDRRALLREVVPEWLAWFKAQERPCQGSPLDELPSGFCDVEPLSSVQWGAEPMRVHDITEPKVQSYLSGMHKLDAQLKRGNCSEELLAGGSGGISRAAGAASTHADASQKCRLIVFLGEAGCDKYKLVHGAMQLGGLASSWKLATYTSPRSPLHLDANGLAACLLESLDAAPGACPCSSVRGVGIFFFPWFCVRVLAVSSVGLMAG